MSIIYDLVIILILAACIFIGWKNGFVQSVARIISYIVALVAANILSYLLALFVYNTFLRGYFVNLVANKLASAAEGLDPTLLLQNSLSAFPSFLGNSVKMLFGENLADSIVVNVADGANAVAEPIVDATIGPVAIMLLQFLFFLIVFFLLRFLLVKLCKSLSFINKIPLVGKVNKILGGVAGAVQGIIIVYIVCISVSFLVAVTNDSLSFLNSDVVSQTLLLDFFSRYNPVSIFNILAYQKS